MTPSATQAQRPNCGFLGNNRFKTKQHQPDWTGFVDFEGVTVPVAGWTRQPAFHDHLEAGSQDGGSGSRRHACGPRVFCRVQINDFTRWEFYLSPNPHRESSSSPEFISRPDIAPGQRWTLPASKTARSGKPVKAEKQPPQFTLAGPQPQEKQVAAWVKEKRIASTTGDENDAEVRTFLMLRLQSQVRDFGKPQQKEDEMQEPDLLDLLGIMKISEREVSLLLMESGAETAKKVAVEDTHKAQELLVQAARESSAESSDINIDQLWKTLEAVAATEAQSPPQNEAPSQPRR